jgi:predicted CopG family antitoxin
MKGNNKFSDVIKEYARKLSDDDLRFINMRLSQRVGADVAEAIELLQHNAEVDHWLGLSKSANELYDMIDTIDVTLQGESKRRFALHESKKRDRD